MIGRRRGRVSAWDEAAGYGTVTEDGGDEWFFHCTAVADGSRTTEQGAQVDFCLRAGHLGRWEAADVRPV